MKRQQDSLTGRLTTLNRKDHFGPDLCLLGPNLDHTLFLEVSALLDIRHCPKLQSCAISRKANDANLRKWQRL